MPIMAPAMRREFATLLRASPTYANAISLYSLPEVSCIVSWSASIWVGCQSSVRPFQTGTPDSSASTSTCSCLLPRNSMPS